MSQHKGLILSRRNGENKGTKKEEKPKERKDGWEGSEGVREMQEDGWGKAQQKTEEARIRDKEEVRKSKSQTNLISSVQTSLRPALLQLERSSLAPNYNVKLPPGKLIDFIDLPGWEKCTWSLQPSLCRTNLDASRRSDSLSAATRCCDAHTDRKQEPG